MSEEVKDISQAKAGALSEANQEILNGYIVAWIDHFKVTQSKEEWKTLWATSLAVLLRNSAVQLTCRI